ncbi:methylated-DNA--[protein]-cysteine S-methyltransferase [Microbulbifer sp. YPW16]|uniref:methylated-DNA--[protein]-cysteine S-methyltransferase n=1 Tax=Microbulbifer sp. YPW16 TaxID=2904242 RepID=UPI00272EB843|nr:methylated-DNA--[protein]-cysteine S-methyltransferase [Microbulbifer sp. YPW16]
MIVYEIYPTVLGDVCVAAEDSGPQAALVALGFVRDGRCPGMGPGWQRGTCALTDMASTQLGEYLDGRRRAFELPLQPPGTPFQQRVWAALQDIPYGETRSYLQQAEALGNPRAVRAVARANGANPLAIVIPCHRVIGADGTLTGYAGGLDLKARLLSLEGARFSRQGVLL